MDKNMYGITILNVEDLEGLFETVDRCKEPVYMISGDQMVDLRNRETRVFLQNSQMEGEEIPSLKLYATCQADTVTIAGYMMRGSQKSSKKSA